jgi:RND family efflux transporter MFP subunit
MSSPPTTTPKPRWLLLAAIIAVVIAGALAANGLIGRARSKQALVQWTNAQAVPTVALAKLAKGDAEQILILPGNIQPYNKAAIYARVNGYLKSWDKDIGAPVKAGDVLASIDTPDLDQQFAQAKATLASAKATYDIAALTASRYDTLLDKQAIAQQIADQMTADAAAKKSVLDADQANVRQFEAMQSFKQITAPFDGVVTARNTDIGALINAGSAAGQQLFEVSDLHRVRIYVQVPQAFSADLRPGLKATFEMPQYPGRMFDATLVATSMSVTATSRSMLVELQADNSNGDIVGGSYTRVNFHIPGNQNMVRLPATALIPANLGMQAAVLGAGNKVELKTIKVGRDFGDSVEVVSGLSPTDKVIDSPPETLQNGDQVQLASTSPAAKEAAAGTPATNTD